MNELTEEQVATAACTIFLLPEGRPVPADMRHTITTYTGELEEPYLATFIGRWATKPPLSLKDIGKQQRKRPSRIAQIARRQKQKMHDDRLKSKENLGAK